MTISTLKFRQTEYLKCLVLERIGQPDTLEIEHDGDELTIWACLEGNRLFQMGPVRCPPGDIVQIHDIKIGVTFNDH